MTQEQGQQKESGSFLSVDQVASRLNVTTHAVRAWRKCGQFPPAFKFGKLLRWTLKDIDEWASTRRERHAPGPSSGLQWRGQALQRQGKT